MSEAAQQGIQALDEALLAMRRIWLLNPERQRFFLESLHVRVDFACVRTVFTVARACESDKSGAPSIAEIAELLLVDPSTASRLVNQAVSAGFIERAPAISDRRRAVLKLSAKGRGLVKRGSTLRKDWLGSATSDWSAEEITTLATLLNRLQRDLASQSLK